MTGETAEQPLYMKLVRDEQGQIAWGRIVPVKTQRASSSPDFERTIRMAVAQKKITAGTKIQRIGKQIEEAGWSAYEAAKA